MSASVASGYRMLLKSHLCTEMVIALRSDLQDFTPCSNVANSANPKGHPIETEINLENKTGDVVLQISIRRSQNAVVFNAQVKQSLLDGWGQPESVPLNVINPSPSTSGLTILVCDRGDKYQILFNLTTVHYFAKRMYGPVSSLTYQDKSCGKPTPTLSAELKVHVRDLDDLPSHERGPINSGKHVHILEFAEAIAHVHILEHHH